MLISSSVEGLFLIQVGHPHSLTGAQPGVRAVVHSPSCVGCSQIFRKQLTVLLSSVESMQRVARQ